MGVPQNRGPLGPQGFIGNARALMGVAIWDSVGMIQTNAHLAESVMAPMTVFFPTASVVLGSRLYAYSTCDIVCVCVCVCMIQSKTCKTFHVKIALPGPQQ